MNCTSVVCKFTKSSDFARANQARFSVSCWQDGEQIFFHYFSFSSKNFLPTPDSTSSSSNQNLEGDLPPAVKREWALPAVKCFPRDQSQQGFFLEASLRSKRFRLVSKQRRTGFWSRAKWNESQRREREGKRGKRENPENEIGWRLLTKNTKASFHVVREGYFHFKQWRQSGANLGIVTLAKIQFELPRCSLSPPSKLKVEVCVCLLESKTNPIHERFCAISCFLLFLDHFTVLNKRTTVLIPISGEIQFCPVLIKVGKKYYRKYHLLHYSTKTSTYDGCN